jgi:NADPH-dependent 2,4-dienoyl-CoA reductase/sulfur reductase-like enzyme
MSGREVVIVGAGPAGMTAALTFATAGLEVTMIDDNPRAGGQVFRAGSDYPGLDPRADSLRTLLAAARGRIEHRAQAEIVAVFPDRKIWVLEGERLSELRPRALLLATGALEVPVPVPGWTLPGVFTLGGLQNLMKAGGIVPAGPLVLAGAGPLLWLVAWQMSALGVPVAAVVDAAMRPPLRALPRLLRRADLLAKGMGFELALRRQGVAMLRGHTVVAIEGKGGAESVIVAALDAQWRELPGTRRAIAARTVAIGFGLRPNPELAQLAGAALHYAPAFGGWAPRRDAHYETSVPGIFAIGDGAGVVGVDHALAEGRLAALAVLRHLGRPVPADLSERAPYAEARRRRARAFAAGIADWAALRPAIFELAEPETVICRCEDTRRCELEAGLSLGLDAPGPLKLRTRAGMGLCQGRTCTPALLHMIARKTGAAIADLPYPTARVPLRPTPLGALAGLQETAD